VNVIGCAYQMTLLGTDLGRCNAGATASAVAEVNVQTSQRLQVAGVFQTTGVSSRKAQALGQGLDRLLGGLNVARIEDGSLAAIGQGGNLCQHLGEQRIECLDHMGAGNGFGDLFRS
jgi:hypothetical protein